MKSIVHAAALSCAMIALAAQAAPASAQIPADRKNDQIEIAHVAKEYSDLRWAFQKTILPHMDQDLMRRVQAMPILFPSDLH
jgi:hypothetical protein